MSRAPFVRFYFNTHADPQLLAAAEKIPGVKRVDSQDGHGGLHVPTNVERRIRGALARGGLAFRVWSPNKGEQLPPVSIEKLREMRSTVEGIDKPYPQYLYPWHRESFEFAVHLPGALLQHAPGAGKTVSAIIWALAYPGTTVIVTGAKGRPNWGAEIRRFTTCEPLVLYGTEFKQIVEARLGGFKTHAKLRAFREKFGLAVKGACSCEEEEHKFAIVQKRHAEDDWEVFLRAPLGPGHHVVSIDKKPLVFAKEIEVVAPHIMRPAPRFIVVSWETLPFHINRILAVNPTAVVFDESHKGKSGKRTEMVHLPEHEGEPLLASGAKGVKKLEDGRIVRFSPMGNISDCAAKLARLRSVRRRLLTTATPIKDRQRDWWAQLDLAEPWNWGTKHQFEERYAQGHKGPFGWVSTGASFSDELADRISTIRHLVPYSVTHAHLPGARRKRTPVSISDQVEVTGFYDELRKAHGAKSIVEVRLAEACARKRAVIIEKALETAEGGGKVVVLTGRKHDCEGIAAALKKVVKDRIPLWMGHGEFSAEERQDMVSSYMAVREGGAILVGTSYAFGEQINLQDTDHAIIGMLPYTPGEVEQVEGRFARLGQLRPVLVEYLIAEDTIDEHVAQILLDKLPAVAKVSKDAHLASISEVLKADDAVVLASLVAKISASVGVDDDDGQDAA